MKKILFFLSIFFLTSTTFADDWNAETYHKHSSSQKEAASELLKHVTLDGNEDILDVGCGDGKITGALAKELTHGRIFGVDVSQSMITFAKENFPQETYPNLSFLLMDAQALQFELKFDYIFSFTALQWVEDHQAFLSGAHQVLKEGGKVAVSFPLGLPKKLQQAVDEVSMKENWKGYFKNFSTGWNFSSKEQFTDVLSAHNFTIEYCEVVDQKDIFPSKEVFQNFISQWFPYLRPLPTKLRSQFMSEVLQRFIELEPLDMNQRLHFNIKRLEVVAAKDDNS